jgi:nucleoside-diphosphate-sugar epimerase
MPTTVCITGGSGFLGAMTVKLCLERGWNVRTTTRNPAKHEERLRSLVSGASSNLTIFAADLLAPNSFDEAFEGCDVVFHTASPFFVAGANEQNVVEPAVIGTQNVFDCAKRVGMKKIVLTSSTAAIYGWYGKHQAGHVMTESDWSDEEALIQHNNWYPVSKQRAEQLAWRRASEDGVDLAVMNPCLIFGEMLQRSVNTSSNAVLSYLNGSRSEIDNCTKCCVAVEDVALAHILAYERSEEVEIWGKRFLLVGSCSSWQEICKVLRGIEYAEGSRVEIPTRVSDVVGPPGLGANPPLSTPYDVTRAESLLGMKFRGLQEMLCGTVMSLEKFGHLNE